MNCLNCNEELSPEDRYCSACGAQVVAGRLTVHMFWSNFVKNFLGWDNKFFRTMRDMLLAPEKVLGSYIKGKRKHYMAPLGFVTLGMVLTLFVFNQWVEHMDVINSYPVQFNEKIINANPKLTPEEKVQAIEKLRSDINQTNRNMLRYYNFITFLILPIYALVCRLTFGKQQNYAEHFVITLYTQGFMFFATIVLFALSFIHPAIYYMYFLVFIPYYVYAYTRLNRYSWGRTIWLAVKFAVLSGLFFAGVSLLVGVIVALLKMLF